MSRELDKNRIISSFSRSAASYDDAATIQRRNAQQLASVLKTHCPEMRRLTPFLEIGAGTGLFTEYLLQLGMAQGMVTDIAPRMVDTLRRSYADLPDIAVGPLDGEQFALGMRFGAVVSASTFQWFSSLDTAFLNIWRHLQPGGVLAFCMFVDGTFRELRETAGAVGCRYPGHRLFEATEVLQALLGSGFTMEHFSVVETPVRYPDTRSFLRSLKAIGSTNAVASPLSAADLRRVMRHYDAAYRGPEGVPATFASLYVLGRKITTVS